MKQFIRDYLLWIVKIATLAVFFLFIVPMVIAALAIFSAGKLGESGGFSATGAKDGAHVAVVELNGVIEDSKEILQELEKQVNNDEVKAIVLRINSPGGAVGPSQDIYTAVKRGKLRKPIVASMGSVAASGGLYSAIGATRIVAQPGTLTGSIGVVLQLPDFHEITDKIGVKMVTIKSGELKDVGNSFRPMTDKERDFLQSTIDVAYQDFLQAVAEGRNLDVEKVRTFADGRLILGSQAKEYGLIDDFGDVYDAARIAVGLRTDGGEKSQAPLLVYPNDKYATFKKLLESSTRMLNSVTPQMRLEYR